MPQYLTLLLECPWVIAAIFICGIGGTFQYGFNISVMTSPSAFIQELVNQTCVQRYGVYLKQWQVSLIWSFTVSIFCIGGLFGSLLSGSLLSRIGRKKCLFLNNFLAMGAAVLMFFSQTAMSFEMIMVGRFLYGINSGVSLSAHPMFLVECTPKRLQAMVGVTIATFISLGKFSGQLLGISELLGKPTRWPWLLGFSGFTSLFQLFTLPLLPESPNFLLLHLGNRQACEQALRKLWGDKDYSGVVEEMLEEKAALQNIRNHSVMELIRNQAVRWQLLTLIVVFSVLQLCGINAVYFYSFEVFRAVGIQEKQLPYAALGTGLCELCTSVTCFMVIENTGKKVLLFRGYMGMSATLVLLIISLYLQTHISWMPYCSMVLTFIFIIFFAGGPAGVSAPFPGHIFTQSFKSAAFTIACVINWLCLFTVGMLFPILVENMGYFCFLIFLFFCATCALYVKFNVPEFTNLTATQVAAEFQKMHSKSAASQRIKSSEQQVNGFQGEETIF